MNHQYFKHKSINLFAAALIAFCFALNCLGQDATASKVDRFVQSEMQKGSIPGLAVAVVKNGQVIFNKGYGLANIEHQVPVKPETIFQTASIGKQFTATAVMILVEEGKINLDEKISKYLGEVPESWRNITVRHLLTHTSGLAAYPDDLSFRRDYTEEDLFRIAKEQAPAFAPEEKWQYSNLGYFTLGVLIHKVTGKFFGDFLRERIFKPLGMNTASVISEASIIPNRAAGYILYDGQLINQPWISPTLNRTADAGLYMTVLDLAKWDAGLYGESILKRTSLEQMWTPVKLNDGKIHPYGFGWFLMEIKGHRLIEHAGAWQGFSSNISRYVDDKLTVIIMDNLKSAKTEMITHAIAGIYIPEIAPPSYEAIADKEPEVTRLVTTVMQKIAEGTLDQGLFTPDARTAFFPDTAKLYQGYLKRVGQPIKIELVKGSDEPVGSMYRYFFYYKNVKLLVSIMLNKDGQIASFSAVDNW